jgi:hypothetical protein
LNGASVRRMQAQNGCLAVDRQLQEGHGLNSRDVEALAAADVLAAHHVVGARHIRLELRKTGAIPLIRVAREAILLPPHQPAYLVLVRFAAVGASEGVRACLRLFIIKIAFFHLGTHFQRHSGKSIPYSRGGGNRVVLVEEERDVAPKKKLKKFSVTKAVKSNARDVVGQPKPAKVMDDRDRVEKRKARHKTTLGDLLKNQEE